MKTSCLLQYSAATICAASLVTTAAAQADKKPAQEPAKLPPGVEEISAGELLKSAVTVMSGLTAYHASGTFSAGDGKATINGDFGVGTVDMQVRGFDGKTTFRRAVKDKFFLSHDSGKTWQEDAEKNMTSLLSLAVTSPLSVAHKIWEKGKFTTVGVEKLGNENVFHLRKPLKGEDPAMDFWIATGAGISPVIRKASFVITADDGEFPVVMTYSKLNEPVEITAPADAAKPAAKDK